MKGKQKKSKKESSTSTFDFKNGKSLVKFLNRIPDLQALKFKLSEEEQQVVGESQNLIVMGRSGTGKTTCALMRMFAIQIIFKNLAAKSIFEAQSNQPYICKSSYIDLPTDLKSVFLTASPMLILQIKSKYGELKNHIKHELHKKQIQQNYNIDSHQRQSKNEQKQKNLNYDFDQVLKAEEYQNARENKLLSLSKLTEKDYPGFYTIRQFIIMLDGCLQESFFIRTSQKNLIQQKGGFIKWRTKNLASFKIRRQHKQQFCLQCGWEAFSDIFWKQIDWKKIIKHYKQRQQDYKPLTAISVWTQIISTIIGSRQAHLQQNMHLTYSQYHSMSNNPFFQDVEKKAVYEIFLYYKEWKQKNKYFDLLDLSNHMLRQVKKYLQKREFMEEIKRHMNWIPDLNYLFLDEVQDLPSAVTYLISQVFGNRLYYSGDTAQTIQKGVSFRFSDLGQMFNKQEILTLPFQTPMEHRLTKNFRSHTQILLLANSIIKILQEAFPTTIDKMNKQTARHDGPKPIVITNAKYDSRALNQVAYLLVEYKQEKMQKQLNDEQVIIVRTKQDKDKLCKELRDIAGLVITIQQCKGMEYNDVIIYNFFDKRISQKWKILKYTQAFIQRGKTEFKLSDIQLSQYEQMITELKMLYTMVTRARCTLVIIDDNIPELLLYYWTSHDLVQEHIVQNCYQIKNQIATYKNRYLSQNGQSWAKKGYNFYMKGQLELALQCYERADRFFRQNEQTHEEMTGYQKMCKKIRAIMLQEKAQAKIRTIELRYNINPINYELDEEDVEDSQWKQFLTECQIHTQDSLIEAAQLFNQISLYRDAAECHFHAQKYKQAIQNYQSCKQTMFKQQAFCYQKMKHYQLAASRFQQCQEYTRMILAIQKTNNYDICHNFILKCPKQYQHLQYFYRNNAFLLIESNIKNNNKYVNKNNQIPDRITWKNIVLENFQTLISCKQMVKELEQTVQNIKLDLSIKTKKINKQCEQLYQQIQKEILTFAQCTTNKFISKQQIINKIKVNLSKNKSFDDFKEQQKDYLEKIKTKINVKCKKMSLQLQNIINNIKNALKAKWANGYYDELYQQRKQSDFLKKTKIRVILQFERNEQKIQEIQDEIEDQIRNMIIFFKQVRRQQSVLSRSFHSKSKSRSKSKFNSITTHYLLKNNEKIQETTFPLKGKLQFVIQQYLDIIKNYFIHAYNKKLNSQKTYFHDYIYEDDQQKPKCQEPFIYIINQFQSAKKIKVIKEKFLNQNIIKPKNTQLMNADQRRNEGWNKCLNHRFLEQLIIQKAYQFRYDIEKSQFLKMKDFKISFLSQIEQLSPKSYIFLTSSLGLRESVVTGVIWSLSYSSRNYINKSSFFKKTNKSPKIISNYLRQINFDYFDFNMFRTNYKKDNAINEIVGASFLLGFNKQIIQMLPKYYQFSLNKCYMRTRQMWGSSLRYNSRFDLERKNQDYTQRQIFISELFSQYQMLDYDMEKPWFSRAKNQQWSIRIGNARKQSDYEAQKWQKTTTNNLKNQIHKIKMQYQKQIEKGRCPFYQLCDWSKTIQLMLSKIKNKFDFSSKVQIICNKAKLLIWPLSYKYVEAYKIDGYINVFRQLCNIFFSHYEVQKLKTQRDNLIQYNKTSFANFSEQIQSTEQSTQQKQQQYPQLDPEKMKTINNESKKQVSPEQMIQIMKKFRIDASKLEKQDADQKYLKGKARMKESLNEQQMRLKLILNSKLKLSKKLTRKPMIYEIKQQLDKFFECQQQIKDLLQIIKICDQKNKKYEVNNLIRQLQQISYPLKQLQHQIIQKNILKSKYQSQQQLNRKKEQIFKQKKNNYCYNQRVYHQKQINELTGKTKDINKSIFYFAYLSDTLEELFNYPVEFEVKQNKKTKKLQIPDMTTPKYAEALLIYFSYQHYPLFQRQVNELIKSYKLKNNLLTDMNKNKKSYIPKNFQNFLKDCKPAIQRSLLTQLNYPLLKHIFMLFKCTIILDEKYLNIFSYFVFVSTQSSLMINIKQDNSLFCFYVDQDRKTLVMKFTDVIRLISSKISIDIKLQEKELVKNSQNYGQQYRKQLWLLLSFDSTIKLPTKTPKRQILLRNIQKNRCRVLQFFGLNAFVSHQSSQFVYHQLKSYFDLLEIASCQKFNGQMALFIETQIQELEKQFDKWNKYASRMEVKFKRQ